MTEKEATGIMRNHKTGEICFMNPRTFVSINGQVMPVIEGLRRVFCIKHGEHEKTFAYISTNPDITFPYCPFCFGEWLSSSFSVQEILDGEGAET